MSETLQVGVVAGCVIRNEEKYLLVQEKKPSVYGLWNLPAGHVDIGETFEEAAKREALEETGLEVDIVSKLAVTHEGPSEKVCHAFLAKLIGGDQVIQPDEILDAKWFSLEEVKKMNSENQLRAPWVLNAIEIASSQLQ